MIKPEIIQKSSKSLNDLCKIIIIQRKFKARNIINKKEQELYLYSEERNKILKIELKPKI